MLAEAGRVAQVLRILLRRAGATQHVAIDPVVTQITSQEQIALSQAYGRIEGRQRFKRRSGSGNPTRDIRPASRLFTDESGRSPHPKGDIEDWFALGAVAMTESEERAYRLKANAIKRRFFRDPELVTFHEPHMRNHDEAFRFGGDAARQHEFRAELDALISNSGFVAFGVGIRKTAFKREFAEPGLDPWLPFDVYSLAIQLLLERYVDFLHQVPEYPLGSVTMEGQGPREDADHQLAVAETLVSGTQWVSESAFRRYLSPGVTFVPKQGSHPVELSDMLARDVFEWIRSDCEIEPARWDLWSEKFYRRADLRMGKFGLKVFPDSDIRERIENHRDRFR